MAVKVTLTFENGVSVKATVKERHIRKVFKLPYKESTFRRIWTWVVGRIK